MSRKKEYETLVFVLDIGPAMNDVVAGENCTFFEQSIKCIEWIVQRKIFSDSKDELALVLFGTQDTKNHLAERILDQYQNVTEAIHLMPANWNFLQKVRELELSNVSGDFVDALVVAFDVLYTQTEGKPVLSRKIIFLSNFGGDFNPDESNTIIKGLNSLNVNLNVIGPDLDNKDNNLDFTSKEKRRYEAQKLMKSILDKAKGECYSFSDAIPQLMFYQTKETRSVPWNANLDIGEDLQIPISSFVKIKEVRPKPFKACYARDIDAGLTSETSIHKNDEAQTEVDPDDVNKAYKYGSTLVPFSEADQEAMRYKNSKKCLSVMGFTKQENISVHYYCGSGTRIVIARKDDEAAATALSALINALYETNMVAIVRYCYSDRSNPKMGFLSPIIKTNYEALLMILLPFMEDIRQFTFPSLTKAQTDEQLKAVDDLITTMNLCPDDEEELLKSSSILNPNVQRCYQCITHRALNPDAIIPKIEDRFLEKLSLPVEMIQECKPIVDRLNRVFSLKVIEKKKKLREGFADLDEAAEKTEAKRPRLYDSVSSGIADLLQGPVQSIGTVTPIQDFESLLKQNEKSSEMLCKEMQDVIIDLVMKSFRDEFYDKALQCFKALREEACKVAFEQFNKFLKDIKSNFGSKGHKEFWNLLQAANITLISSEDNVKSSVSADEAKEFLQEEEQVTQIEDPIEEDADDLLDMI